MEKFGCCGGTLHARWSRYWARLVGYAGLASDDEIELQERPAFLRERICWGGAVEGPA